MDTRAQQQGKQPGVIVNKATGLAIGIESNIRNRGTKLAMWDCDYNWDKLWFLNDDGQIESVSLGHVWGIAGNNKQRGSNVVTWTRDDNWDKQMQFDNGFIRNPETGLVLGIDDNNDKRGAHIVTWTEDSNWDKQWAFMPLVESMVVSAELVFSCDGKSSGTQVIKSAHGRVCKTHVNMAVQTELKASISGPIKVFTAGLDASVAAQFESSVDTDTTESFEDNLTVNLDRPCYVYQLKILVHTAQGQVTIKGQKRILSAPI